MQIEDYNDLRNLFKLANEFNKAMTNSNTDMDYLMIDDVGTVICRTITRNCGCCPAEEDDYEYNIEDILNGDIEAIKKEQQEKYERAKESERIRKEAEAEQKRKEAEEKERQEYLKLKAKFESPTKSTAGTSPTKLGAGTYPEDCHHTCSF
jgi:hypothetical protein